MSSYPPAPPAAGTLTRLARVRGRVQGVGFREACAREAARRGVTGWVRNRSDGSVEATLQGAPAAVAAMQAWLGHGPAAARVESVAVSDVPEPAARHERFERLPTA
jgi:acylphosphatase